MLPITVYKTGWVMALLFFGTWLFPLGYLVYKSRFLPRFLDVLLMRDGSKPAGVIRSRSTGGRRSWEIAQAGLPEAADA